MTMFTEWKCVIYFVVVNVVVFNDDDHHDYNLESGIHALVDVFCLKMKKVVVRALYL